MKTCPTCNAVAFDDAKVCYGCMHRYDEEPYEPSMAPLEESSIPLLKSPTAPIYVPEQESVQQPLQSNMVVPGFTIRIVPVVETTGTIRLDCSVELLSSVQTA